jgi:hypothetical protein
MAESQPGRRPGVRSALIVATDEYQDPGLQRLNGPAADAEALARVLSDPGIGGFEVHTVLNEPAHVIAEAVEEFFAERSPDDLLVVHFSGHGIKNQDGELHFAATNTKLRLLGATSVSANFVNRQMTLSRSRRIVLLLDCCYAGAFDRGMTPRGGGELDLQERFSGRGRAVITASGALEYAFEGEQLTGDGKPQPSIFTTAMVNGLSSGEADRNQDGWVGLDELYEYVYDAVREVTPNQTPGKWAFGVQGDLHIARRNQPVTRPAPLPPELQQSIDSSLAGVRAGGVQELRHLLSGQHAGLALAARLALERLADDDSRAVAAAAAEALDQPIPTARPVVAPAPSATPARAPAPAPVTASGGSGPGWWPPSSGRWGVIAAAAAAILLLGFLGWQQLRDDGEPNAIPSGFEGNWKGDSRMPSEGVEVHWTVQFVEGARRAELDGGGTSSCAAGILSWTGGTESRMTMDFVPKGEGCRPATVTVTIQDDDRLKFRVVPDEGEDVQQAYEGVLSRADE